MLGFPHQIVLIGAGNLATQLGIALHKKGCSVAQVYSRTIASAQTLAEKIDAEATNDTAQIRTDADLYIYAVKDDALPEVINNITIENGIHVHTSGSAPMAVFEGKRQKFGVFYPLQTFKKEKPVDFEQIPVFLEASDSETFDNLNIIANKISKSVFQATSEHRQIIHLSAAFACNFTNHFYAIAADILQSANIPFSVLMPLMQEGINKLQKLSPKDSQTGPAIRNDQKTIDRHLAQLSQHPEWQILYRLITQDIQNQHKTNDK